MKIFLPPNYRNRRLLCGSIVVLSPNHQFFLPPFIFSIIRIKPHVGISSNRIMLKQIFMKNKMPEINSRRTYRRRLKSLVTLSA